MITDEFISTLFSIQSKIGSKALLNKLKQLDSETSPAVSHCIDITCHAFQVQTDSIKTKPETIKAEDRNNVWSIVFYLLHEKYGMTYSQLLTLSLNKWDKSEVSRRINYVREIIDKPKLNKPMHDKIEKVINAFAK